MATIRFIATEWCTDSKKITVKTEKALEQKILQWGRGGHLSISTTLPLRSYLEGWEQLSLSSRKILRSHYEEKSATELYTNLTNSTEGKEEPQDFLLKLLNVKQNILFVLKEEGAEVHYDDRIVTPVFLHTLYIGLNDETLRRVV